MGEGQSSGWRFGGLPPALESVVDGWHLRVVQPYRAVKVYRCPGCHQEIFPRTLHLVVWPEGSPEQRRHWHRACWMRHHAELVRSRDRDRRRAGGRGT
jgi:hypothetical protein